ncbi:MAG: cytochrome C [Hyalangium sp.]|uniref:cytochrome C n=1 Tax=Hyalangium sp. TaxID=2028555 RepID=UPI00389A39CF
MQNDRLINRRALSGGRWLRSFSSLMLAGALLSTTACKDEEKPPEEKPLSAQAEKGLSIVPFQLDTTGLTNADKERIGTGSYLLNGLAICQNCHQTPQQNGPPKYLSGGVSFPIGPSGEVVYARNLTSDPDTGLRLTEAQFIEAIRTGKDFKSDTQNEQLIVMPWQTFRWMTDEDIKSIYAYLQKVPAIKNPVPADIKGAAAAAQPVPFPNAYADGAVVRPLPADSGTLNEDRGLALQTLVDPPGLTSLSADDKALYARGSYIVNAVSDCNGCHTNPSRDPRNAKIPTDRFLTGGFVFTLPPGLNAAQHYTRSMSANLLGATHGVIPKLTFDQFKTIIDTGKVTNGSVTRDIAFPMSDAVAVLKNATDDDLKAIFSYIKNQTPISGAGDKLTQQPARFCAADTDCNSGESCNVPTNECVGATCSADPDCGACQTCSAGHCAAPTTPVCAGF